MGYEWDIRRARCAFILKTASIVAATAVSVGLPLCIVIAALTY